MACYTIIDDYYSAIDVVSADNPKYGQLTMLLLLFKIKLFVRKEHYN